MQASNLTITVSSFCKSDIFICTQLRGVKELFPLILLTRRTFQGSRFCPLKNKETPRVKGISPIFPLCLLAGSPERRNGLPVFWFHIIMFHLVSPTCKRRQWRPVSNVPVPLTCSCSILIAPCQIWPLEVCFSTISILQRLLPKGSITHAYLR